jgi:hypothetical protein
MARGSRGARATLRAVQDHEDGQRRDDQARIARALLRRHADVVPLGDGDIAAWLAGGAAALEELECDPRYLIGRLTQALTALLQQPCPQPDATEDLLVEAIQDAIAYRRTSCPRCTPDTACPACAASWARAERYEALFGLLGLIGEPPLPPPALAIADS